MQTLMLMRLQRGLLCITTRNLGDPPCRSFPAVGNFKCPQMRTLAGRSQKGADAMYKYLELLAATW